MFAFGLMRLVGIQLTPIFNYVLFEQFRIIGNHKHVKICPRHFSGLPQTPRFQDVLLQNDVYIHLNRTKPNKGILAM